jgi:hypothetical protein
LDIEERNEYIEEEREHPPIGILGREHDINSYKTFHRLLNEEWNYYRGEELEERDRLIMEGYTTYTNKKGRLIKNASRKGIDKILDNYEPWTKLKHLGVNYMIKVIENSFVNHIIGTVGFTVAEYFGSSTATDSITGREYSVPLTTTKIISIIWYELYMVKGLYLKAQTYSKYQYNEKDYETIT